MSENERLPGLEIIIDAGPASITRSNFQLGEEVANKIIARTEETKDPYYALDSLMNMERINAITGIAKAKVMHYLLQHWNEYGINAPFLEVMQQYSGLQSPTVIGRYVSIWELFESGTIPDEFQEELKQKPMNILTPLIATLNSGYELNEEQWEETINADSNFQMYEVMREVKGSEPSARSIYFVLDKVSGILYAINQNKKYLIGRLNMASTEDVAKKAIVRLLEKLNVKIVEDFMEEE